MNREFKEATVTRKGARKNGSVVVAALSDGRARRIEVLHGADSAVMVPMTAWRGNVGANEYGTWGQGWKLLFLLAVNIQYQLTL